MCLTPARVVACCGLIIAASGCADVAKADVPVLEARALSFAYTAGQMLLDIPHYTLRRGDTVFLHGPSGSGKSTLLNLLCGTLQPASGSIDLCGHNLGRTSGMRRDRLRGDHIGLLFQQFNLLPFLSVIDNILLPCRFSPARRQRAQQTHGTSRAAAQHLLQALDLPLELALRPAAQLSIGQQQRVAAARALIGEPELVLADEPTSALDADAQECFLELLFRQCSGTRAALLFVSHDLRLASRFERIDALHDLNVAEHPVPHA